MNAIRTLPFGTLSDGSTAHLFILENVNGVKVAWTDYGATWVAAFVPDRRGAPADILLGYPNVQGYATNRGHFGATIGRFAGPIAGGRFTLDETEVQLECNGGSYHIHGGSCGFDRRLWFAETEMTEDGPAIHFYRTSPDGEEGYPGDLFVRITVTLTSQNAVRLHYTAVSDQATLCNLTNHAYFNLRGHGAGARAMLEHILRLAASVCNVNNAEIIGYGPVMSVLGTPLDFTFPRPIGEGIADSHEQIRLSHGYDHNFLLPQAEPGTFRQAAEVWDPVSGRVLEFWTTEPAFQFYSGNFIPDGLVGKEEIRYEPRSGFCLEAQRAPLWPNQPGVTGAILRPGETYAQLTEYRFSIRHE
jgi:aldose 1-epimerase